MSCPVQSWSVIRIGSVDSGAAAAGAGENASPAQSRAAGTTDLRNCRFDMVCPSPVTAVLPRRRHFMQVDLQALWESIERLTSRAIPGDYRSQPWNGRRADQ